MRPAATRRVEKKSGKGRRGGGGDAVRTEGVG